MANLSPASVINVISVYFWKNVATGFVVTGGKSATGVYKTDSQLVALNWEYLRELYKNVKWRYRIIRAQDEDDS
jgi:hypothetical protein